MDQRSIEDILMEKKDLVVNPDWTGCKPTSQDIAEYDRGPAQQ
jgi:hypothetical protein